MAKTFKYPFALTKKFKCPSCGKKTFVLYRLNHETKETFPEHVGKCDRADNCRYVYTPYDYYKDNPDKDPYLNRDQEQKPFVAKANQMSEPKAVTHIPQKVYDKTMNEHPYDSNSFVRYLHTVFPAGMVARLLMRFPLGTSVTYYKEACVFWYINQLGNIRAGQVKEFDETGHTVKGSFFKDGKTHKYSHTTWIHDVIEKVCKDANVVAPQWISDYKDARPFVNCLYGEHQLTEPHNKGTVVHLCEAPKTAIMMAGYMPQNLWLGLGAKDWLTELRCKALYGRRVILYPDLSAVVSEAEIVEQNNKRAEKWDLKIWEFDKGFAYNTWKQKAHELRHLATFSVSDYLENICTDDDRAAGSDIADFMIRTPYREYIKQQFKAEFLKEVPPTLEEQKQLKQQYINRDIDPNDMLEVIHEILSEHNYELEEQL